MTKQSWKEKVRKKAFSVKNNIDPTLYAPALNI